MFDIGWSELLVIAVVLIVVVGPKDLPPMIRAFGKTMAGLRKMAGDFRTQFDEALKEADMDDVRQTISDVRNLNPTNSLRDAMNPLRQLGNEIRSDLQGATTPPGSAATSAPAGAPSVSLSEPEMKLPDGPPAIATEAASVAAGVATGPATAAPTTVPASVAPSAVATAAVAPSATPSEKPKAVRKRAPAKSAQEVEAETVAAKPKRAAKTVSAKTEAAKSASAKPVAPKTSKPAALTEVAAKASRVKAAKATVEAGKPMVEKAKAMVKKTDTEQTAAATPAKTVKTAKAKKGEA